MPRKDGPHGKTGLSQSQNVTNAETESACSRGLVHGGGGAVSGPRGVGKSKTSL